MAFEISERPYEREMTCSSRSESGSPPCAMAIHDMGRAAVSLTGSQAGIVTDSSHTKARILEVRADRIREALTEDRIVLVAGFQGLRGRAATSRRWGRGGSIRPPVALAAAPRLGLRDLHRCRGSLHGRPANCLDACKLSMPSFDEMLEMSASGAGALQLRSVEYARNHGVRIHCRSSFDDGPGTLVPGKSRRWNSRWSAVARHTSSEARVTVSGVADEPGASRGSSNACRHVNVDMIIQNELVRDQKADLSFTVARDELRDRDRCDRGTRWGQRVLADERIVERSRSWAPG